MQKVIDFMGDESVWKTMVPDVVIKRRPPSRYVSKYPTAYFVNDHWTSRKANETVVFDSYNHYQEKGTHGFCQTFAMMYLLDQLPEPGSDYNKAAIYFIYTVNKFLPRDHPTYICHDSKSEIFRSMKDCHLHFAR